jgi:ketosteroid isomerase-like protein
MKTLLAAMSLALAVPAAPAADPAPELRTEVQKGVTAYNTRDLSYFEAALVPDAVYIADDGATFVGKDRVLGLFKRIFAMTPAREIAPGEVAVGSRGDVGWARFKYTLAAGEEKRGAVMTTLFARSGAQWQVLQIQNTRDGHASPGGHAH